MFFGRPIGSALSGLWIRKYNVYKSLLIAALTAAIAIYFFFTAGLIGILTLACVESVADMRHRSRKSRILADTDYYRTDHWCY